MQDRLGGLDLPLQELLGGADPPRLRLLARRLRLRCPCGGRRDTLLAGADVVGPSARVAAKRMVLDCDRPRPDRVEQGTVVRDQDERPGELAQRLLERLAALEVEVV